MMNKEHYRTVGLTAIGGALEFYDFTIYALFAPFISAHFFPAQDPLIGLINTFLVFAFGYLARPLGGAVFGHFGDRFGRKSAFALSVFVMATATLLIGCLPDYQQIGILSPILLILLRLIQGFSVGGEIPGAAVFMIEHVPAHKRGFSIGLVFMCITLGNSIGALVGMLLTAVLNENQMNSWGWRLPFIFGFILGIISYIIRKRSLETPVFLALRGAGLLERAPVLKLLKSSRRMLLKGVLLTAISSSTISIFLYLPTYLTKILQANIPNIYFINLMGFILFALTTAFFGWGSDFISRKKLLVAGALLFIISSYPLFCGLTRLGGSFVWIFSLGFAIFGGMINGSYVVLIAECFPPAIRYSGVGLSYSLGIAIFGGLAPLSFTWLIQYSNTLEAPSLYLLGCGILTLAAIFINREKRQSEMNLSLSVSLD